ncbi:MAG: DUF4268 domain-containing protein [Bacillota bacterium]|jgi:hypothetical protein
MKHLGKLEKLNPREIWADEARDFTPWLKENIHALSEALGLDLEITESEGAVGDFYVDLVGRDLGSGRPVVIENQLGPTDHDHLGKLLTYAAGKDARTAIWVATDFRDEHRQALEWLNSISSEAQLFFGVQVEVFKIGDSLPASNFDVVVQPSDWVKQQRIAKTSPRQEAYQKFFSELLGKVKKEIPGLTSAKKGLPQNWLSVGAGRTGFNYAVSFVQDGRMRVELYIDRGFEHNRRAFELLRAQQDEIEKEMGQPLSWEELPKARRVAVYTEGSIEDPPERLGQLQDWAVEVLGRFVKVFRPRVAALPKDLEQMDDAFASGVAKKAWEARKEG